RGVVVIFCAARKHKHQCKRGQCNNISFQNEPSNSYLAHSFVCALNLFFADVRQLYRFIHFFAADSKRDSDAAFGI
ncbi:MAG: hypothetical protein ACERKO_04805, partial [Acetanaerobacterium sp.]